MLNNTELLSSDTKRPPKYDTVCDEGVILKERRLRSSESDTHYHQSPKSVSSQDLSLYPPVFDTQQETTAETTYELGFAEARERTKVEYRDLAENTDNVQTPDITETGAVGGSDPASSTSTNKLRSFKLRASKLARSRESSADSGGATPSAARDSSVEAIGRTAIATATDLAASSSISQQPEPSAPPGDLTDQSNQSDQQLGQQLGP